MPKRVGLFVTCLVDLIRPSVAFAAVKLLEDAGCAVEVPRLRFAIRNTSGIEIYSWTALPTRSLLSPGETVAFQSRLASPPPETHDVLVRFFNRHDLGVGIQ